MNVFLHRAYRGKVLDFKITLTHRGIPIIEVGRGIPIIEVRYIEV